MPSGCRWKGQGFSGFWGEVASPLLCFAREYLLQRLLWSLQYKYVLKRKPDVLCFVPGEQRYSDLQLSCLPSPLFYRRRDINFQFQSCSSHAFASAFNWKRAMGGYFRWWLFVSKVACCENFQDCLRLEKGGRSSRTSVVSPSQNQPSSTSHVLLGTWCVFTMLPLLGLCGSFIFSNDNFLGFKRKLYQLLFKFF